MNRKLFIVFSGLCILALVFSISGCARTVLSMPACDPAYVTIAGTEITVLPTGVSDTANLQCAFDAAVAAGHGNHVRLVHGTYHIAQIVVEEFYGTFSGAGPDRTIIVNLPNLYVAPIDYWLKPPSAQNPYPVLFTFIGGDYAISDLALRVFGDTPTQDWTFYGTVYHDMACGFMIIGTEAHVEVSNILVEGEVSDNSPIGYNLYNGIYFEGWMEWIDATLPISGSYSLHHSTFRSLDWGSPLLNVANASVVVSHNSYEGVAIGMDGAGLVNTDFEFSHNKVEGAVIGLDFRDAGVPAHTGTTYLVANNQFDTEYAGISFEQTYGEGNECLLVGNNVQQVSTYGVYLGASVHDCTVVGGSSKTNVLDLGTDNILVDVNIDTGVGPTISLFLRP
jgi:hypothetical protein